MRLNNTRDPQAQAIVKASYDYAVRFSNTPNRQAIFDLRTALEAHGCLEEFEMAALVNLTPQSSEEAKVLVPSLMRLSDDTMKKILKDISKFKLLNM